MNVKILFKDYGKGKERLILVDTRTNRAFASFGKKDEPYSFLKEEYDKEFEYANRYKDMNKEELNQLHFDLSKQQAETTNINTSMALGQEMKHVAQLYNALNKE